MFAWNEIKEKGVWEERKIREREKKETKLLNIQCVTTASVAIN